MSTTEQTLRFLEEHIPELAESAVTVGEMRVMR
jgi:hypothetical protein